MGTSSQRRSQRHLQEALALHQAGKALPAAESYRLAIEADKANADAWNLLGVLKYQQRDLEAAERLFREAATRGRGHADAEFNLASLLRETRRLDEALIHFDAAVAARPEFFQAHDNRGLVLQELDRCQEAVAAHRRAVALAPANPLAANNLAAALKACGQADEAIAAYRQALRDAPDYLEARLNLGNLLVAGGAVEAGLDEMRSAAHRHPESPLAAVHLARALIAAGRRGEALAVLGPLCARGAATPEGALLYAEQCIENGDVDAAFPVLEALLRANPQVKAARYALGLAESRRGRYDASLAIFEALARDYPDDVDVLAQLAWVLPAFGRSPEAAARLQQAVALMPDNRLVLSAFLSQMNYADHFSAAEVFERHQAYGARFAGPSAPQRRAAAGSRLRIAYLSNVFGRNALAAFIESVLRRHSRETFEVCCYRTGGPDDEVTARLRALADRWVDCAGWSDQQVAEQIAADGIDLLVDLMGHTAGNRLGVLARRPAPVQATWLGYLNTTGMREVDYRLTDRVADPESVAAARHTEKLAYLPDTQWCFSPPVDTPEPVPSPALANGFMTFGSFNAFHKLSPTCLQMYADVLAALPASRLLLFDIAPGGQADYIAAVFAARGVARARLDLLPRSPIEVFYRKRGEVDVALDSFPYSGGTTTCESLWMGVPVVTLAGETSPSRSSASLLTACGLAHLVAPTRADYVRIALDLARDPHALNALRLSLRDRLRASPVMDIERFIGGLEAAYREMWRAHRGA